MYASSLALRRLRVTVSRQVSSSALPSACAFCRASADMSLRSNGSTAAL
jgi:hypothetical protein